MLEGDVCAEEVEWTVLSDEAFLRLMGMPFDKPTEEMTEHLKPLYIKARLNGKEISRVFVDGGAVLNVMPVSTLRKLGKTKEDLVSTNMKMTNFTGETKGVLVADVTVGSKTVSSSFFMVDAKTTYSILLGRDWIHSSKCVPSTLDQRLIMWSDNGVETVLADKNPFTAEVRATEALFYSPYMEPIVINEDYEDGAWKSCDQTSRGFEVKMLADS